MSKSSEKGGKTGKNRICAFFFCTFYGLLKRNLRIHYLLLKVIWHIIRYNIQEF